jgi:hypothetical protein
MPHVESVPKRDDDVPGTPVTVTKFEAKRASAIAGVRRGEARDFERCAALINRTHAGRDLFRPYTPGSLFDRLDPDRATDFQPDWTPPYCLDDFWVLERGGEIVACAGLWDRGRDVRERWRHPETGAERVVSATNLLDAGYGEGNEDALAALVEHLAGVTHAVGRDHLVAPLETLPEVSALLSTMSSEPETRYLQWRADTPALTAPPYLDLVYW